MHQWQITCAHIYTYFKFWFSVRRRHGTVHHNALGCGLGDLQLIRWDHFKCVTIMVAFCHNHCHNTYKLSNVNKSLQTNTSTKGRAKTLKTHSPFTIFNPTGYCLLLVTQMCDTHHFTAQHFACDGNRHSTVMWQHCFLPNEPTTAPTHSVEVTTDSESAATTASCGWLALGRTWKWRVRGRRPCARVVNKAQSTSLPGRQPTRYSPLKRVSLN